ncbi:MAG: hypothetical protein ACFFFC_14225 [Candidatus Thorarchaeota archaeon]
MEPSKSAPVSIAAPIVSIDVIKKAVLALYAMNKPANAMALLVPTGMYRTTISKAFVAAASLGLVKEIRRGTYELTDVGKEFARAIGLGNEREAQLLIQKQILEQPDWTEIASFLKLNKGKSVIFLDLVSHIEKRLDRKWKPEVRSKIASSYQSCLMYACLVTANDSGVESLIGLDGVSKGKDSDVDNSSKPATTKDMSSLLEEESELIRFDIDDEAYFVDRKELVDFVLQKGRKASKKIGKI